MNYRRRKQETSKAIHLLPERRGIQILEIAIFHRRFVATAFV
jgi:hypothetical protein